MIDAPNDAGSTFGPAARVALATPGAARVPNRNRRSARAAAAGVAVISCAFSLATQAAMSPLGVERSTLNTTRSFSSGLFFEAFAMLISVRQTQTAD